MYMSPGKKELTPNVYLPQQPLQTQTKQLLRMVFPGSKKCLHAWDSYNVSMLCLSVYDRLYRSWWKMCTRNLEQHTDSNFFSHRTGLSKQCYHWWPVMGGSVTVSTSLIIMPERVTCPDRGSHDGTQECLQSSFVFVKNFAFPTVLLNCWIRGSYRHIQNK
jgi:hypothetical protein